jgi:ATP-dependent DNA ligase
MARRDAGGVRLYSRNGYDFGKRFPLIVAAVAALPARSCLLDGEAVVSDDNGLRGLRPAPVLAHEPVRRAVRLRPA